MARNNGRSWAKNKNRDHFTQKQWTCKWIYYHIWMAVTDSTALITCLMPSFDPYSSSRHAWDLAWYSLGLSQLHLVASRASKYWSQPFLCRIANPYKSNIKDHNFWGGRKYWLGRKTRHLNMPPSFQWSHSYWLTNTHKCIILGFEATPVNILLVLEDTLW